MKKDLLYSFFTVISASSFVMSQVGINTANPQQVFHIDGGKDNPAVGAPIGSQQLNDFVVTSAGNVGVGTTAPGSKLEITSGTSGVSGLKFGNINNSTPATGNSSTLGVDGMGNVVVQNAAPIQSVFKSFSINAATPANSVVTIGTLEFRYPATTCTSAETFIQVRSTSGATNSSIFHSMYRTAQNLSQFVNTTAKVIPVTFIDIPELPLDCVNDGHTQFNVFSYSDRTFYRVNIHVADGDNMGFGALGYIYVENQR